MKFTKIISSNYEKSLHKAFSIYGNNLRIVSRKDYEEGLLIKKQYCQLVCYEFNETCPKPRKELQRIDFDGFEDEKDSIKDQGMEEVDYSQKYSAFFYDDDIQKLQLNPEYKVNKKQKIKDYVKIEQLLEKSKLFLDENKFFTDFSIFLQKYLKIWLESKLPEIPDSIAFEKHFLEKISNSFECDHTTQVFPPKNFVVLGKEKCGKSQTSLKVSYIFSKLKNEKTSNVELYYSIIPEGKMNDSSDLILNDDYKDCEVSKIKHLVKNDFVSDSSLNIFDCFTPKNKEERKALFLFLNKLDKKFTKFFLVLDISVSEKVVHRFLTNIKWDCQGIIFTKVDEMANYGPLISLCSELQLPVLFITDGLKIPENIHFASNYYIMSKLKGVKNNFLS
ncbi:MAG: hypothetical protein WC162_01285 [Sphaerochaetaceae bacterium]